MLYFFLGTLFFFLYTYLGYIAIIYILAKVFPKKHMTNETYIPTISLIVPCLNEEMTIADKIKNSFEIDYPKDKLEIIIIDSSSTDRTAEIVKSFEKDGVKLVTVPHNGKAFAMKYTVDNACTGEIVISSDANAFFEKDTVKKVIAHFADSTIGGVTGAMRQIDQSGTTESEGGDLYWRIEKIMRIFESQFHSVISMSGEISCFRKDLVKDKTWYAKGCPDDFNLSLFIIENGYRVLYEDFYFVNVYTSNAKPDLARLKYRQVWDHVFLKYIKFLETKKSVIFCGDLNVAHKEIDLANPKGNKTTSTKPGNAGFTDQERAGMQEYINNDLIDTFRFFYPEKIGAYSWWSNFGQARAKNVGWRIDYFLISENLKNKLKSAFIRPEIIGSDHCPVGIEIIT